MRKLAALISALALLSGNSSAATDGDATVLAVGKDSCGAFVMQSQQVQEIWLTWALGFITGENLTATGNSRLVGHGWDHDSALIWLRTYCTAHPLVAFVQAAIDLRSDLAKTEGIKP